MYRDPKRIRDREVKVRLNEAELAVFESIANLHGGHLAAIVRQFALAGAERMFSGESDLLGDDNEGPQQAQEGRRCA